MKLFESASCEIVPKSQLPVLFIRGVAGIALMAYSFPVMVSSPMLGWTLLAVSIVLLKGCPACWGLHMANAIRGIGTRKATTQSQPEIEPSELKRKRPYQPKDMAEHLFPPEDVARFRAQKQDDSAASH